MQSSDQMLVALPGTDHSDMDFIQRYQPTADESPPWAGISFKYRVDSDALAEQLKGAYPECRTLRERKHKATIEFLRWELEQMQAKHTISSTVLSSADPPVDEGRRDTPKRYIEITSDYSRPQSGSEYTSSISGSVNSPGMVDRTRLGASAGATPGSPRTSQSAANPRQIVWNSLNGQSMRPKTKRKMTVEERKAYKKTREQGACDMCRKQKARCTHVTNGETVETEPVQRIKLKKRRKSSGLDARPDGTKSIKAEHPFDVERTVSEKRPMAPASHFSQDCLPKLFESAAEKSLGGTQSESRSGDPPSPTGKNSNTLEIDTCSTRTPTLPVRADTEKSTEAETDTSAAMDTTVG